MIIVKNDKVISRAYNTREKTQNVIKHAEIIAIEKRNAREEIEGTTLRTKLGGRSLIKRR